MQPNEGSYEDCVPVCLCSTSLAWALVSDLPRQACVEWQVITRSCRSSPTKLSQGRSGRLLKLKNRDSLSYLPVIASGQSYHTLTTKTMMTTEIDDITLGCSSNPHLALITLWNWAANGDLETKTGLLNSIEHLPGCWIPVEGFISEDNEFELILLFP
ncbi:unnamed protein product [Protopolystoma xenopodis]|uniref:Uncharacterized protein n=1 Tax=Protopolystoma xenopodis TaxID=117903 RepID=A0A448X0S0_9PLAT|nr:unnamed protein product [Protopolystoma xenopodis]